MNRALREVASAYLGSTDTDPYRLGPDALAQISVPTLLYWGTRNFGGADAGDALARALPATAEYHCADVGHWAQYEQFDEYKFHPTALHNRPNYGEIMETPLSPLDFARRLAPGDFDAASGRASSLFFRN